MSYSVDVRPEAPRVNARTGNLRTSATLRSSRDRKEPRFRGRGRSVNSPLHERPSSVARRRGGIRGAPKPKRSVNGSAKPLQITRFRAGIHYLDGRTPNGFWSGFGSRSDHCAGKSLEQITTRAHGPNRQTERLNAPAQSQHMDIEGIAPRCSLRPTGPGQALAADHSAESLQQRLGQPGLDRRQRHPDPAEAQDAVVIQAGRGGDVLLGSCRQGGTARSDVDLGGRHPDPILEAVRGLRGYRVVLQ